MFRTFFLEQMMKLLRTSFHIYDEDLKLVTRLGTRRIETEFFQRYNELLRSPSASGRKTDEDLGYPVILIEGAAVYAVFSKGMSERQTLIAGPVADGPLDRAEMMRYRERYGLAESQKYIPSVCPLDIFISGVLLTHAHLTGEEISAAELWERNKEHYASAVNMPEQITQDIFDRLESPGLHNPYEQELRELESIEKGDVQALAQSISEVYEGEIGRLAKDPLRSHKNVAVGNITLASRAAIRGGVGVEQSFSLADSLIQQVEEIGSVPEVEVFKREAQYTYARLVESKNARRGKERIVRENPLIAQVKDYIFNHLHDTIQITDIASEMGVNADYLSHLFSSSEKMTITEYVRCEKVRRGENLLKYSDYQIRDIAFYLGFCSQSHFSKVFRQISGLSPNEYRKKFGNREGWKS